ncbi:MAG: RusA family crossover junction endodeoxyribonuclease [Clostridiaceae bacterium]
MDNYAKIIILGSPISKSNFKLFNLNGRAILPNKSGKYHDRYAVYEEQIALETRAQNPKIQFTESLIAVLKVYYKSDKRHPDTNNITKSIFDGIEKSGLIVNDVQIRRLIIEEFYDKKNPRFELELYGESAYAMDYTIIHKKIKDKPIEYDVPCNKKATNPYLNKNTNITIKNCVPSKDIINSNDLLFCSICGKKIKKETAISCNKGEYYICKNCLTK